MAGRLETVTACVSIRAPVRGRRREGNGGWVGRGFDPRPREGATLGEVGDEAARLVSIRAPVRGRRWRTRVCASSASFDPRPREGATSRPRSRRAMTRCFDPRPREGATVERVDGNLGRQVSIRAPVRGRPRVFSHLQDWWDVSIRASVRGRPCLAFGGPQQAGVSIRAPVRGRPTPHAV